MPRTERDSVRGHLVRWWRRRRQRGLCQWCGADLPPTAKGHFCSHECGLRAWGHQG